MGNIQVIAKESIKGLIGFGIWLAFCYFCDFSFGFFIGVIGLVAWIWAFRNPERIPPQKDSNTILAPIDGEIIDIQYQQKSSKIRIRTYYFSAGFIRAPLPLTNLKVTKKSGVMLLFSSLKDRLSDSLEAKNDALTICLKPRIFSGAYILDGNYDSNERIGFMKIGELELEVHKPNTSFQANIGDKILAGQTILGYIK